MKRFQGRLILQQSAYCRTSPAVRGLALAVSSDSWEFVPGSAVQDTAMPCLEDASPLLEVEGNAGGLALISPLRQSVP